MKDASSQVVGKPTKNRLPGDSFWMRDGGRNIKSKFRKLFVDQDTKGALVVVRLINVH